MIAILFISPWKASKLIFNTILLIAIINTGYEKVQRVNLKVYSS